MTAKEYLMQYRSAVRRAEAALDHIAELRAIAERITPVPGGSGGSHTGDRLGAAVARLVDCEAKLDGEIELLAAAEHEIMRTICAVQDERLQLVLYRRYILGEKWEQIAVNLNLDYRWVLRLHGRALAAVADVLKEAEQNAAD